MSPKDRKVIYAAEGTNVLITMIDANVISFAPCLHEEADTCLFLHAGDAVLNGYKKLCIRTVHTDVIPAITVFNQINPSELWLAFGTKLHFCYMLIHEVVNKMDPMIIKTLLVFHAFTGCDTVSAFGGRGKMAAWNTWKVFTNASKAFEDLLFMREYISSSSM